MTTEVTPKPFSASYYQNPHPILKDLQQTDPVHEFLFPGTEVRMWLVTRYEDARKVLSDNRFSPDASVWADTDFRAAGLVPAQGSILERGISVVDPPDHTRLRRLAMGTFTPRRIEGWSETITTVVDQALDHCAELGTFDLMEEFAGKIAASVLGEILGFTITRARDLVSALNEAFPSDPSKMDRAPAAFGRICEYSAELVETKRSRPADDLTSSLIASSDGGEKLSADELVGLVAALIMGGSDTIRGFLGNAALAMLDHPEQADLVRRETDLGKSAIEEMLRYEGAISSALFRISTEPIEIAGVELPAKAPVIVSVLAANRDPHVFEEPETLDVTRSGPRSLAFGHGLHNCIGSALARQEAQIAVPALLRRFPNLALAGERDSVRYIDNWAIRRLTSLPVNTGV